MQIFDEPHCSILDKLFCYVVRDDQEVLLPALLPSRAKVRDNQEVLLPAFLPSTSKVRDNQEVLLPAFLPRNEKLRMNHDVLLIAVGTQKFVVSFVVT